MTRIDPYEWLYWHLTNNSTIWGTVKNSSQRISRLGALYIREHNGYPENKKLRDVARRLDEHYKTQLISINATFQTEKKDMKSQFFKLVPFVNGSNYDEVEPETAAHAIQTEEHQIAKLEEIKTKPKTLVKQIEERTKNLKEYVEWLDKQGA